MRKFFLLLLVAYTVTASAQVIIPFEQTPQGHILIKALVNGVEGNFVFDTGGGVNVVTKKFAGKANITKQKDGGYTAFRATGERVDVVFYETQRLAVGSYKIDQPEIAVLDADFGPIDGLISMINFRTQPFTIDFNKKQLVLETAQSLRAIRSKSRATVPLQLEDSRGRSLDIFAYFRVNDTLTLQFLLDSGSGSNVFRINPRFMEQLGIDKNDTAAVKVREHRSEIDTAFISRTYIAKVKKLQPFNTNATPLTSFKAAFVDGLIYDGIICIDWMGPVQTFDLARRELLIGQHAQ
ncbi:clan AA aspartic protease [Nostoc ellipsosporum NOK]|nr:clan AA aspartic protease [Nostoc ellipsosporum NOK]